MRLFKIVLFCLAAAGLSLFFSPESRALEDSLPNLTENNTKEKSAPLPDLTIQSIGNFFLAAGGDPRVPVVLSNIGQGNAGNFTVRHEWLAANGEVLNTCFASNTTLNAGARMTIHALTCDNNTDSRRAVKLRTTIDSDNTTVEIREDNNTKEKAMPLSDVVVANIDSFSYASSGEPRASIVVKNNGRGAAATFQGTAEWLDKAGVVVASCSVATNWRLAAGAKTKKNITTFCGSTAEAGRVVKLRIVLDPENKIIESNKNNNIKEAVLPLSDLRVSGVNFKGQDKLPEITIINKGVASTGRNFYVTYEWFDIDGQRLGVCHDKFLTLGLNKKFTQKKPFCGNIDTYVWATKFNVTIDAGQGDIIESDILESNENNNSLELPVPGRANLRRVIESPLEQTDPPLSSFPTMPSVFDTPLAEVKPTNTINPPADESIAAPDTTSDFNVAPTGPAAEAAPTTQAPAAPIPTVSVPAAPAPTVVEEETVREPSFSMTVTQNSNDATVTGKIDYYGKGAKCSGPRPTNPVIVRWGDAASEPNVVNSAFSASHTYFIKNKSYTLSVSVYNSCYGMKTLTKKMLFTF